MHGILQRNWYRDASIKSTILSRYVDDFELLSFITRLQSNSVDFLCEQCSKQMNKRFSVKYLQLTHISDICCWKSPVMKSLLSMIIIHHSCYLQRCSKESSPSFWPKSFTRLPELQYKSQDWRTIKNTYFKSALIILIY